MSETNDEYITISANHDPTIVFLESVISKLLRAGVMVSVALIVVGSVLTFVQNPTYLTSFDRPRPVVPSDAKSPHAISIFTEGLSQYRGEAIVTLGLMVLLATPVARVCVSIAAFTYYRDRIYICLTVAVLCLLLLSLVLGSVE
jgi:uncharacterized membrane protein